jgi:hypothetical protein
MIRTAGLKIFLEARVDVTILEVGIGGIVDATNCFPQPYVCGISSLGFDHMELLGNTLPVSLISLSPFIPILTRDVSCAVYIHDNLARLTHLR